MAKNKSSSKFLLDSSPMIFYPEVAKVLGLNEAIFIQQLNYWIQQNQLSEKHWKDGRIWVWNTLQEWQEYNFVMWSERTISRIVKNLVDKKIIIKKKYNYLNSDQTLWYTIDYDVLDKYLLECEKTENQRKRYKNPMDTSNTDENSYGQSDNMSNTNASDGHDNSNDESGSTGCGKPVDNDVDNSNNNNESIEKQGSNTDKHSYGQSGNIDNANMSISIMTNWQTLHITENTISGTTLPESNSVSSKTLLSDTWENIKENLKNDDRCKLTDVSMKTWIEPLDIKSISYGTVILKTDSNHIKEMVNLGFKAKILNALQILGLKDFNIEVEL